jgi:hypothetical protein
VGRVPKVAPLASVPNLETMTTATRAGPSVQVRANG